MQPEPFDILGLVWYLPVEVFGGWCPKSVSICCRVSGVLAFVKVTVIYLVTDALVQNLL